MTCGYQRDGWVVLINQSMVVVVVGGSDGKFLYEITAESLEAATGAQIPEEPSYLIINTAGQWWWCLCSSDAAASSFSHPLVSPLSLVCLCVVSATWGFPHGCPEGCPCNCYDCSKPECRCAMPTGFCDSLPASMLVDWVSDSSRNSTTTRLNSPPCHHHMEQPRQRDTGDINTQIDAISSCVLSQVRVYQNKADDRHLVGCDHPKFPTKKFIAGHEWRYMRDKELRPLLPLKKVSSSSSSSSSCCSSSSKS